MKIFFVLHEILCVIAHKHQLTYRPNVSFASLIMNPVHAEHLINGQLYAHHAFDVYTLFVHPLEKFQKFSFFEPMHHFTFFGASKNNNEKPMTPSHNKATHNNCFYTRNTQFS